MRTETRRSFRTRRNIRTRRYLCARKTYISGTPYVFMVDPTGFAPYNVPYFAWATLYNVRTAR